MAAIWVTPDTVDIDTAAPGTRFGEFYVDGEAALVIQAGKTRVVIEGERGRLLALLADAAQLLEGRHHG